MHTYIPNFNAYCEMLFALDSKEPTGDYQAFLANETRYARLAQQFPERAKALFVESEAQAKAKYERLTKFVDLYNTNK